MRSCYILVILAFSSQFVQAQTVEISTLPSNYTQNFNSLASSGLTNTWTNGATLNGWYARNEADVNNYTIYRAGSGSSSTTGLYSLGEDADRALGSLNQNASGDIAFGVLFENTSGLTINSVTIAFSSEQWSRVETNTKGFQRVQVAYRIANSIDVSAAGLFTDEFTDVPEAYLIAQDCTTVNTSEPLIGNDNSAQISVNLPIAFADGQELFLRFYDENVGDFDLVLGVDDLSVTFFTDAVDRISGTSDYNISSYLDAAIIADIPSEGDGISYLKVSEADYLSLEDLFADFYDTDYANAAIGASSYDYVIAEMEYNTRDYTVLRKESTSDYYWGTYVVNANPAQANTAILAPHPIRDFKTGSQAVAVFDLTQASELMVAGISRCTSTDKVECAGTTEIC
ncbi:MAG: hypothetical protein AAGC88_06765, partial [Bacteroidota bacterium]